MAKVKVRVLLIEGQFHGVYGSVEEAKGRIPRLVLSADSNQLEIDGTTVVWDETNKAALRLFATAKPHMYAEILTRTVEVSC